MLQLCEFQRCRLRLRVCLQLDEHRLVFVCARSIGEGLLVDDGQQVKGSRLRAGWRQKLDRQIACFKRLLRIDLVRLSCSGHLIVFRRGCFDTCCAVCCNCKLGALCGLGRERLISLPVCIDSLVFCIRRCLRVRNLGPGRGGDFRIGGLQSNLYGLLGLLDLDP